MVVFQTFFFCFKSQESFQRVGEVLIGYFLGGPEIGELFQKLFLRLGSYLYFE